jgi:ferredoxin
VLLEYAEENRRSERWVKESLWRLRRPKRRKSIIDPIMIEDDDNEISFAYKLPYRASFLERFKVIGDLDFNNGAFTVKSDFIKIRGRVQNEYLELKVRCDKANFANSKRQIEKLLSRLLNCIGCGACTSSCPQGVLKVMNNVIVVSEKCNRCGICLKAPCVIEDAEKLFAVKMDPFIVSPCGQGLRMNHILFPSEELGKRVARKLLAKQVNIELHEGGKVLCVDVNFPRWRLARIAREVAFNQLVSKKKLIYRLIRLFK